MPSRDQLAESNFGELTTRKGLPRAEIVMSASGRPLAEHVDPALAEAAVQHYGTRRTPAGLLHSAWAHAEYAINHQCPPEAAPHYIDTAVMLLGDIVNNGELVGRQKVHQDTMLHAFVLSTYLPLFVMRAEKRPVQSEDCRMTYKSLGRALRYLQPLEVDEPPQWRMVETAVLALSARIGRPELLLYPASPREESSTAERLNHDSYFYSDDSKLPIQQKLIPTPHEYDEEITLLVLEPLITKALQSTGEYDATTPMLASDKVNILLSRIVAETAGIELSRQETKFLNFLTQALAAHHTRLTPSKVVAA